MSGLANLQPFECRVCQNRFTRRENLKRHAALHLRSVVPVPCSLCSATFSREDLRRRHMRRQHGDCSDIDAARTRSRHLLDPETIEVDDYDSDNEPGILSLSDGYQGADIVMVGNTSFDRATNSVGNLDAGRQLQASTLAGNGMGIPIYSATTNSTIASNNSQALLSGTSPVETTASSYTLSDLSPNVFQYQDCWLPSARQITRGLDLFFRYVSHYVPFLHPSTFDENEAPAYLTLCVLSLSYHYQDDQYLNDEEGSSTMLAIRCFHRARSIMSSIEGTAVEETQSVAMIQAYVLLQICAMLYLCGTYSTHALRMHPKMIALVRSSGLMQRTADNKTEARCLSSLWREFISSESRKRTVFAVHQLDSLYYQLLSMPRMLSHLEIKHDLPCPLELWTAGTAAEWAHKRLTNDPAIVLPSYIETVREFLSANPCPDDLSRIDSYGGINIAHFLISSAREISGWSAMTGRVSMDRFEPLRFSLEAFLQSLDSRSDISMSISSTFQATWEIAMIELQLWSPSHTSGSVAESIDSVLHQWTSSCRGPWSETLFSASKKIQPHLDWYLKYLDETIDVKLEAPWVILYAYRAFLAALELLRGGDSEAMSAIGIRVGEWERALEWARSVFERRKQWALGRLILVELDGIW